MKRNDFIGIIRLRSFWRIDKSMGDYKLPNGKRLSGYIKTLVKQQLRLDRLGIAADGNIYRYNKEFETVMLNLDKHEKSTTTEQNKRITSLVAEIMGG